MYSINVRIVSVYVQNQCMYSISEHTVSVCVQYQFVYSISVYNSRSRKVKSHGAVRLLIYDFL